MYGVAISISQTDNVAQDFSALLLAIFLALGMAFMAASFITFIVQERVSKVHKTDNRVCIDIYICMYGYCS